MEAKETNQQLELLLKVSENLQNAFSITSKHQEYIDRLIDINDILIDRVTKLESILKEKGMM